MHEIAGILTAIPCLQPPAVSFALAGGQDHGDRAVHTNGVVQGHSEEENGCSGMAAG
jgi:hypothetical protein